MTTAASSHRWRGAVRSAGVVTAPFWRVGGRRVPRATARPIARDPAGNLRIRWIRAPRLRPRSLAPVLRRALAVTVALAAVIAGLLRRVQRPGRAEPRRRSRPVRSCSSAPAASAGPTSTEQTTPNLWQLLRDGSSAALSVRSVYTNTCPVDGWLGVSAGARAAAPRPGTARNPAKRPCRPGGGRRLGAASGQVPGGRRRRALRRRARPARRHRRGGRPLRQGRQRPPGAGRGRALATRRIDRSVGLVLDQQLIEDLDGYPVTLVDVGSLGSRTRSRRARPPGVTRARSSRRSTAVSGRSSAGPLTAPTPRGLALRRRHAANGSAGRRTRPAASGRACSSPLHRQAGLAQAPDVTATALPSSASRCRPRWRGAPLTSDPAPDNSQRRAQDSADLPCRLRRGEP